MRYAEDRIGYWPGYGGWGGTYMGAEGPPEGGPPGPPPHPEDMGPDPREVAHHRAMMARRGDFPFGAAFRRGWGGPFGPWGGLPTYLEDEVEHNRYPSLTLGPSGRGAIAMRVPLAIENRKIAKGCSERLEAVPQRFGKIIALVIPRLISNQVAIGTITVGVEVVNAGLSGLIPGDYFAADSFHSNMNTFTAIPNQPIFIEVHNCGDADLCFFGAFTLEVLSGPGVHLYGKVRDQ